MLQPCTGSARPIQTDPRPLLFPTSEMGSGVPQLRSGLGRLPSARSGWILTGAANLCQTCLQTSGWAGCEVEVRARQRRQRAVHRDIWAEYSSQKRWRNIVRRQRRLSLLLTLAGGRKDLSFYLNLCLQWKSSGFSQRHQPTRKDYFSPKLLPN